jgi:uncharacterized membrane protein
VQKVEFEEVRKIIDARCVSCHAQKPSLPGLVESPKGVMLDTPERIHLQATKIREQVLAKAMPPGNLTGLTEEERALLGRWQPER